MGSAVGEAVAVVESNIRGGADSLKLFAGSWISRNNVLSMPQEIATAWVRVALHLKPGQPLLYFQTPLYGAVVGRESCPSAKRRLTSRPRAAREGRSGVR